MTSEMVPQTSDMGQVLAGPEGDFLRRALEHLLRQVMEAEVTAQVGAALHERSDDRMTWRNGYRPRTWETRVGPMLLEIPKLRQGTYFPSFLEPRKRSERALLAVVQEAFVHGVSTRKVDDLVKALGCSGVDKSTVSRICKELDEEAEAFRTRSLEEPVPYVWLDAIYEKVREGGHVRSMAECSRSASRRTGRGRCWGSTSATARTRPSGRSFCAAWSGAASTACSW
jgi:transposase-like protein